jgi:hypothetical protein
MCKVRTPSVEVAMLRVSPVRRGGSTWTFGRVVRLQRVLRSTFSPVETLAASILQLSTTRTDTVTIALRLSAAAKRELVTNVTQDKIAAPNRTHRLGMPRGRVGWLRSLLTPIGIAESVPAIHESQLARFFLVFALSARIIVVGPARTDPPGSRRADDGHIARQKSTSMRMVSV